ncbi:MAG: hypothetical protein NTV32_06730, partial [Gammaproteobacteria bacterium]|nr:hypothetical protein [Gammaproteobacteria bacterium]
SALLSSVTAFIAFKYKPTPAGFGYANSASYWLSLCSILGYLALRDDFSSYALFQKKGMLEWRHALPHLKKGAYMMASPTLECLLFAIFSGLIGREGQSAAEAFSVANQYARIVILTSFSAVAGPLGTLMMRYSDSNYSKLTACFHAGLTLGICIATPVLILAFAIPFSLIRPFNAHPKNHSLFNQALMVIGAGGVMDGGIRIPSAGAIRSFNRDNRSLVINVSGLSVGFLMAVLSHFFGFGPIAMILGLYLGISIAGLAQAWDVYTAIAAAPQTNPVGEQQPLISPMAFAAKSPAPIEGRPSAAPSLIGL